MATHDVKVDLPGVWLGKVDAKFEVYENGMLLGTLGISKGAVVWWPKGTTKGSKMRWSRFHEMMEEHSKRYEKR